MRRCLTRPRGAAASPVTVARQHSQLQLHPAKSDPQAPVLPAQPAS